MNKIYLVFLLLLPFGIYAQNQEDYIKRLKAIQNNGVTYYNVDGIDFTSQTFTNSFTEKDLKFVFRKYGISNEDLQTKDTKLSYNNLHVLKSKKITDSLSENSSYYFIEDKQKMVTVICFAYFEKPEVQFEQKLISLIIEDAIPMHVFENKRIDSVDFAGRKIHLSNSCYWTNVNTVQCPGNGEMNWSVHKTEKSAKQAIKNQLTLTKIKKGLKIISEQQVDVIFESNPAKALKVVYGFTGLTNLAVKTSGGKTLTAFYVASKVRENYVSCVMSFWNNDQINESGLPPLLEKVMQLHK